MKTLATHALHFVEWIVAAALMTMAILFGIGPVIVAVAAFLGILLVSAVVCLVVAAAGLLLFLMFSVPGGIIAPVPAQQAVRQAVKEANS